MGNHDGVPPVNPRPTRALQATAGYYAPFPLERNTYQSPCRANSISGSCTSARALGGSSNDTLGPDLGMVDDPSVYRDIYRRLVAGELTTDAAARAIMAAAHAGAGPFALGFEGTDAERARYMELFDALQLLAVQQTIKDEAP